MNNKGLIERLHALSTDNLCFEPELSFDDYKVIATALEQADAENAELAARLEVSAKALAKVAEIYPELCELLDALAKANPMGDYGQFVSPEQRAAMSLLRTLKCLAPVLNNSTLTTSNAVKQIEARAYAHAADICKKHAGFHERASETAPTAEWREVSINLALGAGACESELRKLAEQREQEGKCTTS